jgi:hypothetical protein
MKAYSRSRGTAPFILNLSTRMTNFTPRPLYAWRKNPWHPLNRRPGRLGYRAGLDNLEKKKNLPLPGIKPVKIWILASYDVRLCSGFRRWQCAK